MQVLSWQAGEGTSACIREALRLSLLRCESFKDLFRFSSMPNEAIKNLA